MSKAVFCIAKSEVQAEAIVNHLKGAGFSNNDISVLFPDKRGTRDFAHEQIGKGAACLERARVLQELKLHANRPRVETEVGGTRLDDGRAPNVRSDERLRRRDALSGDQLVGHRDTFCLAACLPGRWWAVLDGDKPIG